MTDPYKSLFLHAAEDWVCDSSSIDIRYVAQKDGDRFFLIGASLGVSHLPLDEGFEFRIKTDEIHAGQIRLSNQKKENILAVLNDAAQGRVAGHDSPYVLIRESPYAYHSELIRGNQSYAPLHLRVVGNRANGSNLVHIASCRIDEALRQCTPPFDGLQDLMGWLDVKDSLQSSTAPVIDIYIAPPVDLVLGQCGLDKGELTLRLRANLNFDLSRLGLAIREVPGIGVKGRRQVASAVKWRETKKVREGVARVRLVKADSAQTMLSVGNITLRRWWFLDQLKSGNNRLVSVQLFDRDLKQIKAGLFETADPDRFERAVAALLFLMGFSCAVQLETQSPDIVATTPSGRMVLVECTLRIADFSSKLGKLVDRKNLLLKTLQDEKPPPRVNGVLVCALPRDQILSRVEELRTYEVILVTKDELLRALDQLRLHNDPDSVIDKALAEMARSDMWPGVRPGWLG